jgi:hypothetical protein
MCVCGPQIAFESAIDLDEVKLKVPEVAAEQRRMHTDVEATDSDSPVPAQTINKQILAAKGNEEYQTNVLHKPALFKYRAHK